jgi:hypothetical protein
MTAADRAAALLREFDANRQRDLTRHAPNCEQPGTTTTHGHSVDVVKCDGCGCLSTTRHMTTDDGRTDWKR